MVANDAGINKPERREPFPTRAVRALFCGSVDRLLQEWRGGRRQRLFVFTTAHRSFTKSRAVCRTVDWPIPDASARQHNRVLHQQFASIGGRSIAASRDRAFEQNVETGIVGDARFVVHSATHRNKDGRTFLGLVFREEAGTIPCRDYIRKRGSCVE